MWSNRLGIMLMDIATGATNSWSGIIVATMVSVVHGKHTINYRSLMAGEIHYQIVKFFA